MVTESKTTDAVHCCWFLDVRFDCELCSWCDNQLNVHIAAFRYNPCVRNQSGNIRQLASRIRPLSAKNRANGLLFVAVVLVVACLNFEVRSKTSFSRTLVLLLNRYT